MHITTVHCDICGVAKGKTNHWLIAVSTLPPRAPGIGFAHIDAPLDTKGVRVEHICGHACATKRFSQWLEKEE